LVLTKDAQDKATMMMPRMVVTVLFFFFAFGCHPVTTGFCPPRPVLVGSPTKMKLKG
jgi:hypothetical protein